MVLGTADTLLQYELTVESDLDWIHSISGPAHPVYNKAPTVTLELTYYIDQMAAIKTSNIMPDIEERLASFLKRVNGSFMQRTIEPIMTSNSTKLYYRIQLATLEGFQDELARAAQIRLDAEFTKALEAKLLED